MNPKRDPFFSWLSKNLSQNPPAEIDQRIMSLAHRKLSKRNSGQEQKRSRNPFLISVFASLLILVLFSNKTLIENKTKPIALNEPTEMILNYRNIELMADASELTEEDWNTIEGLK